MAKVTKGAKRLAKETLERAQEPAYAGAVKALALMFALGVAVYQLLAVAQMVWTDLESDGKESKDAS